MIKKILFSSLQRFDLKDANELQQGVLDKLEYAIKLVSPLEDETNDRQTYPITAVRFTGNSNGELVPAGPFAVMTNTHDIIVITQADIDAGLCTWDYTAAYADYQSQVAQNNRPSGLYFWAYPVYENSDTENREFYSIIDGAPYQQNVQTRERARLETFVNSSSAYNIPNEAGYYPILVAYIQDTDINAAINVPASPWQINNIKGISQWDTVMLPNTDFSSDANHPNYAAADQTTRGVLAVDLDTYNTARDKNINEAFTRIERELLRIKSFGVADPTDTTLSTVGQKNSYSLNGLKALIDAIDTNVANTKNFTVGLRYTKSDDGFTMSCRAYYDVPNQNEYGNEIAVVPRLNYLQAVGVQNAPGIPYLNSNNQPVVAFSEDEDQLLTDIRNLVGTAAMCNVLFNIHIRVPDAYAGYQIENLDVHFGDKYVHNPDLGLQGHYTVNSVFGVASLSGSPSWRRYIDLDGTTQEIWDQLSTVSEAPAYVLEASGSTLNNDPGFNIKLMPATELFTACRNGESFMVVITGTIRKRNNV